MQYPKLSVRMIKGFRSPSPCECRKGSGNSDPVSGNAVVAGERKAFIIRTLSFGYCMRTYTKVKQDTYCPSFEGFR